MSHIGWGLSDAQNVSCVHISEPRFEGVADAGEPRSG